MTPRFIKENSYLTPENRASALANMSTDDVDILVIGGGVTGAGIALDAASRGLRTAIVEAGDWATGTSAWSSKLVHGGLRYLYNLDFKLVAEALKERGLLLTTTAPHLVKAQPFLWPLKIPVIQRSYSAVGIAMYDSLALIGSRGKKTVPIQHHFGKKGTRSVFPDLKDDNFTGSIQFYDARVDDARLVIDLIRTAAGHGALVASRTQVIGVVKNEAGIVTGANITDLETGETHTVRTKHIINATGVWTEESEAMANPEGGLKVLASKGIHIVVPRDRISATSGIFTKTEKSVLFIIPWQRYWIIGTTDTPYHEDIANPVATRTDIRYVLDQANKLLRNPLTEDDIIGTYAGLRPLLQPGVKEGSKTQSTKVSREHTVTNVAPGMSAIAGGKLTTYRVMAEDAVNFALGTRAASYPCVTESTPLVGADGFEATQTASSTIAQARGWSEERMVSLLERYGSEIATLISLIDADPELGTPLAAAPQFLKAEIVFAVRFEGAMHLDDVLVRRVRLDLEQRDRGLATLDEVVPLLASELGWSPEQSDAEVRAYTERVRAIAAAETKDSDAEAVAELATVHSVVPRV